MRTELHVRTVAYKVHVLAVSTKLVKTWAENALLLLIAAGRGCRFVRRGAAQYICSTSAEGKHMLHSLYVCVPSALLAVH